MSSTPPAIPTSISPASIAELIIWREVIAEPQYLLITLAAAVSGIPAKIDAPLATNIPVGPSGNAHPSETSSIRLTSNFLFLSKSPLIT